MKLLLLLVMCWSYCCCSFLPAEQPKQNQNGTDATSSPSDGLSAGEIVGYFFGAIGAVAGLLTIVRMIGSFITHICVKKNNKQRDNRQGAAAAQQNVQTDDCDSTFAEMSAVSSSSAGSAKNKKPTLRQLQYLIIRKEGEEDDEFRLMDRIEPEWEKFAKAMGCENYQIRSAAKDKKPEDSVRYIMTEWERGAFKKAGSMTWEKVIKALKEANLTDEAEKLENNLDQMIKDTA